MNNLSIININISYSNINHLPENFVKLINLTKLKLEFYSKQSYENIYKMKNLKILDLSGNKLTKIPESIENLVNLEKLYLNDNLRTWI